MNYSQIKLYRSSWAPVKKALIELGGFTDEEVEAERLQILQDTAGKTSSKDLSQRELDQVLDAHDRAAVLISGPTEQNRSAEQPIKRLIHRIEAYGFPDAYIAQITRSQFKTSEWRELSERQLIRLSFTLDSRKRRKATTKT